MIEKPEPLSLTKFALPREFFKLASNGNTRYTNTMLTVVNIAADTEIGDNCCQLENAKYIKKKSRK